MPDQSRFLHGPFAPVEEEITAFDLPVTGLVIIAAQEFTSQSVARVHLPARIPLGFQGSWIPDQ